MRRLHYDPKFKIVYVTRKNLVKNTKVITHFSTEKWSFVRTYLMRFQKFNYVAHKAFRKLRYLLTFMKKGFLMNSKIKSSFKSNINRINYGTHNTFGYEKDLLNMVEYNNSNYFYIDSHNKELFFKRNRTNDYFRSLTPLNRRYYKTFRNFLSQKHHLPSHSYRKRLFFDMLHLFEKKSKPLLWKKDFLRRGALGNMVHPFAGRTTIPLLLKYQEFKPYWNGNTNALSYPRKIKTDQGTLLSKAIRRLRRNRIFLSRAKFSDYQRVLGYHRAQVINIFKYTDLKGARRVKNRRARLGRQYRFPSTMPRYYFYNDIMKSQFIHASYIPRSKKLRKKTGNLRKVRRRFLGIDTPTSMWLRRKFGDQGYNPASIRGNLHNLHILSNISKFIKGNAHRGIFFRSYLTKNKILKSFGRKMAKRPPYLDPEIKKNDARLRLLKFRKGIGFGVGYKRRRVAWRRHRNFLAYTYKSNMRQIQYFFKMLGKSTKKQFTTLYRKSLKRKIIKLRTYHFMCHLNRRLDLLLRKSFFFFKGIFNTRQSVLSKSITVNGISVKAPSYMVDGGDILSIKNKYWFTIFCNFLKYLVIFPNTIKRMFLHSNHMMDVSLLILFFIGYSNSYLDKYKDLHFVNQNRFFRKKKIK